MAKHASRSRVNRAVVYCSLAVVLAVLAWFVPARWRTTHPRVLEAAAEGTPGVAELIAFAVRQQRLGQANLVLEAAIKVGIPGSRETQTNLAAAGVPSAEIRVLGGPDAPVAAMLPGLAALGGLPARTALEVFLPADHRVALRRQMTESRSPGVQKLLKILELPSRRFVPVSQAGGQPLEGVGLLAATLYERERLSPTLAQEIRDLADLATGQEKSLDRLEEALLSLLTLARRMDWTSLAELTRKTPDVAALGQFATATRLRPDDFPLLYAGAILSGDVGGTAQYLLEYGDAGRSGLEQALRSGAGAVRWLARDLKPVRAGVPCPGFVARAVFRSPLEFAYGRTIAFFGAALLLALGLMSFWTVDAPDSGVGSGSAEAGSNWLPVMTIAVLTGGFLIIASEPIPSPRIAAPKYQLRLDTGVLTNRSSVANPSENKKHIMGPTTLLTIGIFAAFQLAVYIICLRKLGELTRLPDPPLVRLRLLENEENLFDSGLYVGIGGTAAALVLQVLQMVEANLLAAYSSNLMGIICVALVKIGHVRSAKRRLILASQDTAQAPAIAAANPVAPVAPVAPLSPASEPVRANPFATR